MASRPRSGLWAAGKVSHLNLHARHAQPEVGRASPLNHACTCARTLEGQHACADCSHDPVEGSSRSWSVQISAACLLSHLPPDSSQQDGIACLGGLQCLVRQWLPCGVYGCPANQLVVVLKLLALLFASSGEDFEGLGHDFGADAIAGQDTYLVHLTERGEARGAAVAIDPG